MIHGSRSEFAGHDELIRRRDDLRREDEVHMTFDRLKPNRALSNCLCIKQAGSRFRALSFPATVRLGPACAPDWRHIDGIAEAAIKNTWLSARRRAFIGQRLPYWREWAERRSNHIDIVCLNDVE